MTFWAALSLPGMSDKALFGLRRTVFWAISGDKAFRARSALSRLVAEVADIMRSQGLTALFSHITLFINRKSYHTDLPGWGHGALAQGLGSGCGIGQFFDQGWKIG